MFAYTVTHGFCCATKTWLAATGVVYVAQQFLTVIIASHRENDDD